MRATPVVEISFTTDPADAPVWVDVTSRLRGFETSRGRQHELDRYQAGTGAVLLKNHDRALDPTYELGTYYPNVRPMKRIRLSMTFDAVTYRVLTGFTDGYPQTWPGQVDAVVAVSFADGFKVLALTTVGGTFPEQATGERVGALLDDAGWPAADRDVDTGRSDIQSVLLAQSTALANLQLTELTENGRLFVTKEGLLKFGDRWAPLLPPADESLALFGDGGGDELPYADLRLSFDDTNVWNEVRVAREGGTTQVAEDTTSQTRYFRRTYSVDTLITADAEAADAAAWLLNRYAEPALRADELVVKPMGDDRLWPVVLGLELGDRITVRKRPPGGGAAIERDVIIEGIKWTYDLESFVWRASVSPANVEANWAVWGLATWGVSKWAY